MLTRLFQMFVQDGRHRKYAQGGLGIGLGLVRTLVEMHGGSVEARSDGPGTGSEFLVRLPAHSGERGHQAPPAGRGEIRDERPRRRRILVADDNIDAANSLARLLTRLYGQEVRVAYDGDEALAVAEDFRPEVVVLDIGMPGMDGNEVARRLRDRPEFEATLILALTGWGSESDRRKSKQSGFDWHLVKPIGPEAIRAFLTDKIGDDTARK
jgi:CheY-like chemotaxis protein